LTVCRGTGAAEGTEAQKRYAVRLRVPAVTRALLALAWGLALAASPAALRHLHRAVASSLAHSTLGRVAPKA